MFGLISFCFKILFASILGAALYYKPNQYKGNENVLKTSLICLLSASILALTSQFSSNNVSFSILAVAIIIISISKELIFIDKILWIFASIIGMTVGAGYIFQASVLCAFVYFIIHNSKNLLEYINKDSQEAVDGVENISN
tara:strand:- start:430 stop:852 length:423 start_codon:yes stop_codon:yes gene_type:complete